MKNTFKLSLKEKVKIYGKEISQEIFDSMFCGMSLSERIKYEAIPMARCKILREIRSRAVEFPDAKFKYNKRTCLYSNHLGNDYQLILEIPETDEDGVAVVKYISAKDSKGRTIIAAIPFRLHREIAEEVKRITRNELTDVVGGRMNIEGKSFRKMKIYVYGKSQEFGRADHNRTVEILKDESLEAKIMWR